MKHTESYNVYSFSTQNQIQSQPGGVLAAYSAGTRAAIVARFWAKVKKTESCWLWTASVTGSQSVRYGQFKLPRVPDGQPHVYAHRLAWELQYGPIPDGLKICHKCDIAICCRGEHLFLGTQQENLQDASRKGRLHIARQRRLSPADRLAIYHMPDRRGLGIELALRYRVTKTCISLIRSGRFIGSPMDRAFVRVPHVDLPVRGEVR